MHRCDTLRQPVIKLKSCRVKGSSWDLFKEHHYLTETMNGSSRWTMFAWEQVFFFVYFFLCFIQKTFWTMFAKMSVDETRVFRHELLFFFRCPWMKRAYSSTNSSASWALSSSLVHTQR